MVVSKIKFTRDYTQIIKGVALLFMMILHVVGNAPTLSDPIDVSQYPVFTFFIHHLNYALVSLRL